MRLTCWHSTGNLLNVEGDTSPCAMPPTAAEVAGAESHLSEHGWCVIKNVVSADVASESRDSEYHHMPAAFRRCSWISRPHPAVPHTPAVMDDFLGPPCEDIEATDDKDEATTTGSRWFQKSVNWPEPAAAGGGAPVLHTGGHAHSLQHPLRDARSASVVGPMAPIMQQLLRSTPETLKLFHQNYRRTDPSPPPDDGYPEIINGAIDGAKAGFHVRYREI